MSEAADAFALADVRILDLTNESGAFSTRLLADLGAEVIRVEAPDGGSMRRYGPFVDDVEGPERSFYHLFHNMNKRSIVVDFNDPESLAIVRSLMLTADILIESGSPGYLAAYALDYASVSAENPALTYVSISPFGQDGPWSHRSGNDLIAAASGGILGISGSAEEAPMQGAADLSYKMAGLAAAVGALLSFHGVRRGARGAHVDISVQEATTMVGVQSLNPCIYTIERQIPRRQGIFGPLHRCADGKYVAAHAMPKSLADLQSIGESRNISAVDGRFPGAELIKQLAAGMTSDEVMALVEKFDLIGLPVGTQDDIYRHAHFQAINQFETVRRDDLGIDLTTVRSPVAGMAAGVPTRPAPMLGESTDAVFAEIRETQREPMRPVTSRDALKPLQGVRVLDFSWVLAGPLGTRILANFGADVIRIESEERPDIMRVDGVTLSTDGVFNDANLGKRSLTLDMSRQESIALVRTLVQRADVVVENFRPGVLERMGLGYDELVKINAGIIVAHLPGCGVVGPWAKRGTFGGVLMAAAGLNELSGFEGNPPYGVGCAFPDFTSPYFFAIEVLAALRERERTGRGQEIIVNQLSSTVSLMGAEWMRWGIDGGVARNANRNENYCPHGVYRSQGEDEWCAIAVQGELQWQRFCEHLELFSLLEDPRFSSHSARRKNEDALDVIINEVTENADSWELAECLQALGIAAARVETLDDMIERDPQLRHRNHYVDIESPSAGGAVLMADAEPIRFVGASMTFTRAPMLGEHSEEILTELAGLSVAEVAALVQSGVIR